MARCKLINALEMSEKHPDTFEYPAEEIEKVRPGDAVKVCNGTERFWVMVEKRDGNRLRGKAEIILIDDEWKGAMNRAFWFSTKNVYQVSHLT